MPRDRGVPEHGDAFDLRDSFLQQLETFVLMSDAIIDKPVMVPPGRTSDSTRPDPSGSPTTAITSGIVTLARRLHSRDCGLRRR